MKFIIIFCTEFESSLVNPLTKVVEFVLLVTLQSSTLLVGGPSGSTKGDEEKQAGTSNVVEDLCGCPARPRKWMIIIWIDDRIHVT